jgi:hypothetical protein
MPGDPKECREHARSCQRLADTAINEEARQTFTNLAQTWLRLASELEVSKALLDTWSDLSDEDATKAEPLLSAVLFAS